MTPDVKACMDEVLRAQKRVQELSEELEAANQQANKALEKFDQQNFAGVPGSVREIVTYFLSAVRPVSGQTVPTQTVPTPIAITAREAVEQMMPPYPESISLEALWEKIKRAGYRLNTSNPDPTNYLRVYLSDSRTPYEWVSLNNYRRQSPTLPNPLEAPSPVTSTPSEPPLVSTRQPTRTIYLTETLRKLAPPYPQVWTIEQAYQAVCRTGFELNPNLLTSLRRRVSQTLADTPSSFERVSLGVYRLRRTAP